MKIALDPYMFRHVPLLELPALVAELGYEYIELSPRPDFIPFFVHPRADTRRIQEEILAQRDQLISVLEAHLSLINIRQSEIAAEQNQVVRRLTLVSTVFLPLTFITGFYGQNFGWLVSHIDSFAAFALLGIAGLVIPFIGIVAWFKRGGYA